MAVSSDALWVLLGALAIDAAFGDPDWLWRRWPHPVAWMGRLIASGDRRFNRPALSRAARKAAGTAWLVLVVLVSGSVGLVVELGLRHLPGGAILVALAASVLLAGRSLYDHVARVRTCFGVGGLAAARRAVSMIVGRDPDSLDEAGVARAAIESAAENFSDGLVAPAFWFALGGLPALAAYKAVNTADSMIGHLSERHRDFGWASARLDDGLNWLPARLSGVLLAAAAPLAGGSIGASLRTMWRDASLHRSPNAGWPESAMAGALGLALAGPRRYASGLVDEPFLNASGRRDAGPADIGRALRVTVAAEVWFILALAALAVLASD